MNRYFSMYQKENTANIHIYGDITSWEWYEDDVSSYTLVKTLESLGEDVENINVYINSYGGEVAEGLAIYNALKRHKAKVTTYVDGFACSIASVIFCAGDERIMSNTSLLMIHNAWTLGYGNSNDFKKQAEDLEKITQSSINAYMNIINITEEELKEKMDNETWLNGNECLTMGFATKVVEDDDTTVASQNVRKALMQKLMSEPKQTSSAVSREELDNLIQTHFEKFKAELTPPEPQVPPEPQENKPMNMLKALFK